jgi:glycosyltransferase involved in cell wall biosynthesis
LKILFVAHSYPRWAGDRAGGHVHRLAAAGVARGHSCLTIAPHAAGAKEGDEILDGVTIRRFRYASDAGERIGYQGALAKSLGSPSALLTLPRYFIRFRQAVRDGVAGFAPDVVSVHWWAPGGIAAAGSAAPVAVTCHGSDVRLLGASALIRMIGRRVLARVQGVSAVSQLMADDLRRWAARADVVVTRLPVDEGHFTLPSSRPNPPLILFAGNLIPAKGVDVILRAAAILHGAGVPFRLRFVGDGPGRNGFEALARQLHLDPIVDWAGARPHDQMPAEFAAAAIAVLASRGPRGEGLPMMLVEAMMSGCAVVATPAGGIPELVVDEETGLIARDGDAAHLAAQLDRLLLDPALTTRLAQAGRTRALAQHAHAKATDGFFDFLHDVAGRGMTR